MDQGSPCDEDVHAWSEAQARLLRDLAASGLRLPNELDLGNIAEEIESAGNAQLFQVESNLLQALVHLIKLAALPGAPETQGWLREARAFRRNARRRFRPSMPRKLDLETLWREARDNAREDLAAGGWRVAPLPEAPPFGLAELLGEAAAARALVGRVRDATDARGAG